MEILARDPNRMEHDDDDDDDDLEKVYLRWC